MVLIEGNKALWCKIPLIFGMCEIPSKIMSFYDTLVCLDYTSIESTDVPNIGCHEPSDTHNSKVRNTKCFISFFGDWSIFFSYITSYLFSILFQNFLRYHIMIFLFDNIFIHMLNCCAGQFWNVGSWVQCSSRSTGDSLHWWSWQDNKEGCLLI